MSKNIKIGKKTYTGVKYINCACADEEGVYRKFVDVDDIPVTSKAGAIVSGTVTSLTAEDLAGATTIYYKMFANLTSIVIPDSVTSISDSAFNQSFKLTSIVIPNSVISIGSSAFYGCSKLTSIVIPNSVTSIGSRAFYQCYELTSITLSNAITNISNEMFENCPKLPSIVIPNSVTSIGSRAFYQCYELQSIVIPNSVISIGSSAFIYCNKLASITIPDSVTTIGSGALQIGGTSNKATITFESTTPPTISGNTFNTAILTKIIVPAGCGDTYKAATNWAAFADYIEEAAE